MSDGTIRAIWIVKMPSMPKLYLGPGLSQRVHQALTRRLERFMANTALPAASEFPISENPPMPAQAGAVDLESEKEEEQGITHPEEGNKSPADKEERDDDRSRSPRPRVPEPDPNDPASLLASTTALAIGVTSMNDRCIEGLEREAGNSYPEFADSSARPLP